MNHRLLECLPVFGLLHDRVSDNRSSLQSHVSRYDDHHCHSNLLQPNEEPSILNPSWLHVMPSLILQAALAWEPFERAVLDGAHLRHTSAHTRCI